MLGSGCNETRVRSNVTSAPSSFIDRLRIGYGRVSARDQNPDAQRDALAAAGCEQIFVARASGKLASRPELDRALLVAREGDHLVITKLGRLGRSLEHLKKLAGELQSAGVDFVVLRCLP